MEIEKQLSIIIPTYSRYRQPVRTIEALRRQIAGQGFRDSVEVLLVDDGNEPQLAERLRNYVAAQNEPFLRYVASPENRGASAAYNLGAASSRGALVAFLDDDIVPADDYISATVSVHRAHPEALVINGNLRPLRNDIYSQFWFYYYDAVFNRPGQQFYTVKMLASGHFSIKRKLFELENPLFDTSLTAREDFDFYLRLEKRGIPVYKEDSIIAFNDCRSNLYQFLKQRTWYGRGQEQLVQKHGAAFIAAKERNYDVPPNRKFLHLYLLLRFTRKCLRLYRAAAAMVNRTGARADPAK